MDFLVAGEKRLLQLNELEEFQNDAYEYAKIYKERLRHCMTSKYFRENLNPNNKFSFSIQGFGCSLESSSQDGLDHSLSRKYST